jgi:hypothetical protein
VAGWVATCRALWATWQTHLDGFVSSWHPAPRGLSDRTNRLQSHHMIVRVHVDRRFALRRVLVGDSNLPWSPVGRCACSLRSPLYLQLIFSIIAFAVIAEYDGWSKGTRISSRKCQSGPLGRWAGGPAHLPWCSPPAGSHERTPSRRAPVYPCS